MVQALDRIVPLYRLTKLIIEQSNLRFNNFIKILNVTPHLRIFVCYSLSFDNIDPISIKNQNIFRCALSGNKINTLDLRHDCTLEQIRLITDLFPQLECFRVGTKVKEMPHIVEYILSNQNKLSKLFFLCMFDISRRYLNKLNIIIETKRLLDIYLIKLINHDMYLWW